MWGKRKSKVGLGERRRGGTKSSCKDFSLISRNRDGKEGGFVVINGEAGSTFKELEDLFSSSNCSGTTADEDEGVVCVLEHGAGGAMEDGVLDVSSNRVGMKQAFKNVSNDDKKVWGEGVSLSETVLTVDPFPKQAIKQNGSLASAEKGLDPRTPSICEPP
jgi:hypothetical protein